jgi:hypothetical protein
MLCVTGAESPPFRKSAKGWATPKILAQRPASRPVDSLNREYDIFEELPNGSTAWRACVFGMASVESKLREMSGETSNRLFAVHLLDRAEPVVCLFEGDWCST